MDVQTESWSIFYWICIHLKVTTIKDAYSWTQARFDDSQTKLKTYVTDETNGTILVAITQVYTQKTDRLRDRYIKQMGAELTCIQTYIDSQPEIYTHIQAGIQDTRTDIHESTEMKERK